MSDDALLSHDRITDMFDHLAPILSDMVGGPVHLVRIIGPRWSYVAGFVPDELPFTPPQKIMLSSQWAILCYTQGGLPVDEKKIRDLFLSGKEGDHDAP